MKLQNFTIFFLIFVTGAQAYSHFEELDKLCQKFIHFESICYFYDFSDNCYPWLLRDCHLLYYSAHEPNCITYHCQVKQFF